MCVGNRLMCRTLANADHSQVGGWMFPPFIGSDHRLLLLGRSSARRIARAASDGY